MLCRCVHSFYFVFLSVFLSFYLSHPFLTWPLSLLDFQSLTRTYSYHTLHWVSSHSFSLLHSLSTSFTFSHGVFTNLFFSYRVQQIILSVHSSIIHCLAIIIFSSWCLLCQERDKLISIPGYQYIIISVQEYTSILCLFTFLTISVFLVYFSFLPSFPYVISPLSSFLSVFLLPSLPPFPSPITASRVYFSAFLPSYRFSFLP